MSLDIDRSKKVAKVIYLAADKVVADDISKTIQELIAEVEKLQEVRDKLSAEVDAVTAENERLQAQLDQVRKIAEDSAFTVNTQEWGLLDAVNVHDVLEVLEES